MNNRGGKMILFDISEWIANLLVLGIAVILWAIGIFIIAMLINMAKEWINNLTGEENEKN
jgi:uncharacterized protein YggT (Ycf19 family)